MMKNPAIRRISGPTPPVNGIATKFWSMASISEDEGVITMYGPVQSSRPVDWWTGEPVPGLFITPEGFMEDLEVVKNKARITIKINSTGGDSYTGIAIHNAIKGLNKDITSIDEGIAGSAASIILCAGNNVQVWPGSLVMIHTCSAGLNGYFNEEELQKIAKGNQATDRAAAEIYAAKTGQSVDDLLEMMKSEYWMTGRDAVEEGFADELLGEENGPVARIVGRNMLMIAGVKHDTHGLHIPESLGIRRISSAMATAARAAEIKTPGNSGKPTNEGGKNTMYNSVDELRQAQPDLVQQIEAHATSEAISAERERLRGIEDIASSVGDEELVRDAKYGENPCSAGDLALKAMQKQAKLGEAHLDAKTKDNKESGVQDVNATDGEPDKPMTKEARKAAGRAAAKAAAGQKEEK